MAPANDDETRLAGIGMRVDAQASCGRGSGTQTVVGEVQAAVNNLHALAIHGAIVIACFDRSVQLRKLDTFPWLQHIIDDGLPVPVSV